MAQKVQKINQILYLLLGLDIRYLYCLVFTEQDNALIDNNHTFLL